MIKVKTCTQVFSTRFLFTICGQVIALTLVMILRIIVYVLLAEHSANDAFKCVRGRRATPGPREEKVLYNLLSVVWPQVSTCGKKEPMSTHCNPRPAPQEVLRCTRLVPHGDFKTLSPLGSLHRLRSRNHLHKDTHYTPLCIHV